jgi:hypothetical protein
MVPWPMTRPADTATVLRAIIDNYLKSLIASTRGVGLLRANDSPILKLLLSRLDELVARASNTRPSGFVL